MPIKPQEGIDSMTEAQSIIKDLEEIITRPLYKFAVGQLSAAIEVIQSQERRIAELERASAAQGEPTAWALADKDGVYRDFRGAREDLFGSIIEWPRFSEENTANADRNFAGLAPHSVFDLYTAPPPPDADKVRDQALEDAALLVLKMAQNGDPYSETWDAIRALKSAAQAEYASWSDADRAAVRFNGGDQS